jgi:hypothetical protein
VKDLFLEHVIALLEAEQRYGQHPYPAIFKFQPVSRIFRRWKKLVPETARVTQSSGSAVRYLCFCRKQEMK